MLKINWQGKDYKVPEKIVVIDPHYQWLFGKQVLEVRVEPDSLYVSRPAFFVNYLVIAVNNPGTSKRTTWFYPEEIEQISFISYEKFLKLKCFI